MAKPLTIQQIDAVTSNVNAHKADKNNPHGVTAALLEVYKKVETYSKTEMDKVIDELRANIGILNNSEILTSSGEWVPPKVGFFAFLLIGGGGGSGSQNSYQYYPTASGGGGSGGSDIVFYFLQDFQPINCVIGAGGAGPGAPGTASSYCGGGGGSTYITIHNQVFWVGGGGGGGGAHNAARAGGGGGGGAGLTLHALSDIPAPSAVALTNLGTAGTGSYGAAGGGAGADGADGPFGNGGKSGPGGGAGGRPRYRVETYGVGAQGSAAVANASGITGNPGCIKIIW